jgi:hypothetical protein
MNEMPPVQNNSVPGKSLSKLMSTPTGGRLPKCLQSLVFGMFPRARAVRGQQVTHNPVLRELRPALMRPSAFWILIHIFSEG